MLYGKLLDTFSESYELEEVSFEEYCKQTLAELIALEEAIDELDDEEDLLDEGANIDYIKEINSLKKKLNSNKKELKKYKKAKDKKNFIKACDEGIKICEESRVIINKIDPSVGSTVISVVIKFVKAVLIFVASAHIGQGVIDAGSHLFVGIKNGSLVVGKATKTANAIAGLGLAGLGGAVSGTSAPLPYNNGTTAVKAWNQYRKNALMLINKSIDSLKIEKKNAEKYWD